MREIKFRGLDINGRWFHGLLSISQGKATQPKQGSYISNSAGSPFAYQVRPETVGEYTGLKDKNVKEIYEGDILRAPDPNDPMTLVVKWYDYGGTNLLGINTEAFEVIGNIYEHPHLLK